jgi:hypothetical protein
MPKIMKRGIVCVTLALAWIAVSDLRAQNQKELLPAPVPAQIFKARKVFVSNAGGDTLGDYSGGPDRAYSQLYAALKRWGRYELVGAPADAELVFEISFARPVLGEKVSGGGAGNTPVSSRPVKDPQFRLAILDVKTHVLLWTIAEHVQSALLQGNRDKNFDQAMAALVNDIRNVAGQPAPTANSK